ncbi:hypothetical protein WMY93_015231 [Mugilogobius chulae]|uniref:Ig-like domain-containing protein n=1 Tax=Mugilogobius chulae TaxID=88201 RepID=A0AAW0NPF4_9GOBI
MRAITLSEAATDLKDRIMARMSSRQPRRQLQRLTSVILEVLREQPCEKPGETIPTMETKVGGKNQGSSEGSEPVDRGPERCDEKTSTQENSEGLHCKLDAVVENYPFVSIKCGIYKGDALSPLLFCIGLNPLSQIINKTGYGYRLRNGATISHLLYMDDIKLYAKSERDIDSLIHTTRIYSTDIGMSFGLDKCSRMVTKRGKHLRLYTSRKEGGRGLVSVRATIQDETSNIHKYIKDKAPTDGVLSECLRQWGTDDEVLEEEPSWEDKPLHGTYHRNITEVADLKISYQWLERAGLKDSTEALILAAQEQALSTRAIEAQIYHTRQDPSPDLPHQTRPRPRSTTPDKTQGVAPVDSVLMDFKGDHLICSSENIYPEPIVSWSPDSASKPQIQPMGNELFSVSSSLFFKLRPPQEFTCNISSSHSWKSATYSLKSPVQMSSDVSLSCSSSSSARVKSLKWTFNSLETILTQTGADVSYSDTWRPFVERVSESGDLSLTDLSSKHQGVYLCEVHTDQNISYSRTQLGQEPGESEPGESGPGLDQVSLDQVSLDQVSLDQVSLDQVSLNQVWTR